MALYPTVDWIRQSPLFNTARDDTLDNTSHKCASDASGNFYFVYRTNAGGVASGQISPGASDGRDIILVKLDSNGNTLYVKQTAISGAANESNPSLAIDSSGNIYISCITSGTLSGTTEVNVGNHNELAIIKLDTDGNVLWIKQDNTITPSTASADHSSIAVDNNGFVYVGFNSAAVISGGSYIGAADLVIIKLSAATGARQWLTSGNMLSSAGGEEFPNIAVVNQSLYLLYRTNNTSSILGGAAVVGSIDLVLSKFNTSDGSRVWIQTGPLLSTTASDNDVGMAVDQSENVFVSYSASGVISGGTGAGGIDAIVVKFDSNGNRLWAHQNATTSTTATDAYGPRIVVDSAGDAYISYRTDGAISGDAGNFDTTTGKFVSAAQMGGGDIVVAKLAGSDGTRIWATQKTIFNTNSTDQYPFISIVPGTKTVRVLYQTSGAVTGGTNLQRPVADAIVCEFDSTGTRTAVFQGPTFNTTGTEAPIVTRLDSAGNMYVAYITTGGSVSGASTTANSDVVIAKFNSSRVLQWARQANTISTPQTESLLTIAVDASQNVFVAYTSTGTVSGGVGNLGGSDIIFIKLNPSGNREWTMSAAQNALVNTSVAQDRPQLEIDPSGNVYMAYRSAGAVTGGTASGSNDIVVAKFDTNGNRIWVRQDNTINTATDDSNQRIAVSSAGEVYLSYIIPTGGFVSGGAVLNSGQTTAILIKLNSSGVREWFVHDNNINAGSSSFGTFNTAVCLDPSGNVYITVQVANAVAGATTSAGGFARADIAVVKYNSAGVKQWAVQTANMNTGLLEQAPEIVSDITGGNVYVAYRTSGTSSGNTRPASDYLTKTDQDLIITKISWAGVVQWTRQNGTFNTFEVETSQSIAVSGDGSRIFLAFQGFPLDGGYQPTLTNSTDMAVFQMTEQTLPTQPYNLSASNASSSSVTLQWTIDSLGTAPLNGYYISIDRKYAARGSASLPSNFIPIANVTSLGSNQYSTTLALSGDGDYTVSIWASTGFAPSPTSATVSFLTSTTEPSAPQNLAASGKDGTLYLTWDNPATGFAASYIVTLTDGVTPVTRTVTAPFTSFTGLATGTSYTATVKAANSAFPSGATATATTTYTMSTTRLSAPVVEWIKQDATINTTASEQFVSGSSTAASQLAKDSSGNVYITFTTAGVLSGIGAGNFDVALAKISPSGERLWAIQRVISTAGADDGSALAVDASNNVILVYRAQNPGVVSGGTLIGGGDMVIIKLDSNGNILWTKQDVTVNTVSAEDGFNVITDKENSIYIGYYTTGTVSGGMANRGQNDAVILKLDSSGNRVFMKQEYEMNDSGYQNAPYIAVDDALNIYVLLRSTTPVSGGTAALGSDDVILLKYNKYGAREWVAPTVLTGSTTQEFSRNTIKVDKGGNIYITYANTGGGVVSGGSIPLSTNTNIFLQKFDTNGNRIWINNSSAINTTSHNQHQQIDIDEDGNVYLCYSTPGTVSGLGAPRGGTNIIVSKFDTNGNRVWGLNSSSLNTAVDETMANIVVYSQNQIYIAYQTLGATSGNTYLGSNDIVVARIGQYFTPDAPTNLVATPGDASASISFTAPVYTGGSAITNYKYSLNGGTTFTAFSPAQTTSPVTITGLTNGQTYNIQIEASNTAIDGLNSATVTVTPRTVPQAPADLVATPGDSSVSIAFTAPNDGGSAITNYKYSIDGGATFTAFSPAITASPAVITGLINGTSYDIQIEAVNAAGDGLNSATVTATPRTVPQAPTSLVATPGDHSVSIAFTAPSDGGSAITNYKYSMDGGATFTAFSPAITASPAVITGLTNGTSYDIQLLAVNAAGDGSASSQVTTNPVTYPQAPTSLVATPGDQSVSIAFTAPNDGGSAITNYKYSLDGGATFTAFSPAITASPAVITGLTNGTSYDIQLLAVNVAGDGTASATVASTPRTTPQAPTNLVATPGNQSVSVSFTAPSDGGSAITNYKYSINGGSTFTAFSPAITSSPAVITGLTNGTSYDIQLLAVNAAGDGLNSATVSATPVTAPQAPTSLVATPADGAISLAFTMPSSDGGSPITNYKLSTDGGATFTALSPAQTTSPIAISGLTNGRTYQLQLKAVNAVGDSSASSQVSAMPVASSQPEPTTVQGLLEHVEDLKTYLTSFVNPPAPILSVPAVPVTNLINTAASGFDTNATYTIKFVLPENGGQSILTADIAIGEIIYVPTNHGAVFSLTVDSSLYVIITGETSIAVNSVSYNVGDTVVLGDKTFRVVFTGSVGLLAQNNDSNNHIPCIVEGQSVLTSEGYRKVETLKDGDLVVTGEGRQVPVKVYRSSIAKSTIHSAPICITMNDKTIRLSPHHAYKVNTNGWMIPSVALTAGFKGVTQDEIGQRVVYYHLETPNYLRDDIVLEGCVVESYGRNYIKANSIRMCELYMKSKHGDWYERIKSSLRSRNVPR